MKKRILAMLLTVMLMVGVLSVGVLAAGGKCGDHVYWAYDYTSDTLTISGAGEMKDYSVVFNYFNYVMESDDRPWYYTNDIKNVVIMNGVTSIGQDAFKNCTKLTKVQIPDSVTEIGHEAFRYCTSLTEVTIGDSVTSIGNYAFMDCTSLTEVTIGDSVTSIGDYAFEDCVGLTEVTIGDSVTSIGDYAFEGCVGLTEVTIPDSVTSIGNGAFEGCVGLTEVTIPDSVTSIGIGAFTDCTGLTEIEIPDSVTEIGDYAFIRCTGLTEIEIPGSVTSIEEYAFENCTGLTEVTIPDSVTYIGESAFENCTGLTEIEIPDSVTSIGRCAFENCTGLTEITIPDSVTYIRPGAFYNCKGLKSITMSCATDVDCYLIPEDYNHYVFGKCQGLEVTLYASESGSSVKDRLAYNAGFEDSASLEKLILEEGVTAVESGAFSPCKDLISVEFPESLTEVGKNAFLQTYNLKDVYYAGSMEQWEKVLIENGNASLMTATVHPYWGCEHKETTKIPAVAATCETTGLTEGAKCARCGEVVKAQKEIVAIGHDYEENILNQPTCTQYGMAKYICKNDESHFYVDAVDPLPHDYDFVSGVCTVCGAEDPDHVENPFNDVAATDWFAKPVLWAFSENVTGGTSPTTFGPNNSCTRAQVVTFLWAANGKPEPKSENPFTDVAEDAWYLKPVLWAVENGITTGVTATEFGPEKTCTRAQIATFLYAAAGKPEVKGSSIFSDVADGDWFAKPIIWAAENDVTGGIGDGKFGPNNTCTRGQVVTFLYKVYGNR